MATFRYKALKADGAALTGELDAASSDAAITKLRNQGLLPVSVTAASTGLFRRDWRKSGGKARRLPGRLLVSVTRELANLLDAGLPLDRALSAVAALDEMKAARPVLSDVTEKVRSGGTLASALSGNDAFPKFYVSMVQAGEAGGTLGPSLFRLADYLKRGQDMREGLVSAIIYPAALAVTGIASVVVIMTVVIPQFEPMFTDAGRDMPLALGAIIAVGDALEAFGLFIALALIGLLLLARHQLRLPRVQRRVGTAVLKAPVTGGIATMMEVERFSRSLGTLLSNGVDLPAALKLTKEASGNHAIRDALERTATGLREGGDLAGQLGEEGLFPAMTLDMIKIGQETGRLDHMLLRHADMCERRVQHTMERLLALLVPGLTIVFGLLVAGLVGTIIMAILSVNELAL